MNEIITEAVKQVPALTVLVFVVVVFLRFLKFMVERQTQMAEGMTGALHENTIALTKAVSIIENAENERRAR